MLDVYVIAADAKQNPILYWYVKDTNTNQLYGCVSALKNGFVAATVQGRITLHETLYQARDHIADSISYY